MALISFGVLALISEYNAFVGVSLLAWAIFALFFIQKIYVFNMERTPASANSNKPVKQLLKGIVKKEYAAKKQQQDAVTRTSIGLLSIAGFLLCAEIWFYQGRGNMLESVSFISLCALVFFVTQTVLQDFHRAYLALLFLVGLMGITIMANISFFTQFSAASVMLYPYYSLYGLGAILGFVFLKALFVRHRHQGFAVLGLCSLLSMYICLAHSKSALPYDLLFLLWCGISIAWTQSRPTSKAQYSAYSFAKRIYLD